MIFVGFFFTIGPHVHDPNQFKENIIFLKYFKISILLIFLWLDLSSTHITKFNGAVITLILWSIPQSSFYVCEKALTVYFEDFYIFSLNKCNTNFWSLISQLLGSKIYFFPDSYFYRISQMNKRIIIKMARKKKYLQGKQLLKVCFL